LHVSQKRLSQFSVKHSLNSSPHFSQPQIPQLSHEKEKQPSHAYLSQIEHTSKVSFIVTHLLQFAILQTEQ